MSTELLSPCFRFLHFVMFRMEFLPVNLLFGVIQSVATSGGCSVENRFLFEEKRREWKLSEGN